MEQTYVMLKPDAVRRGLIGAIVTRLEQKGFIIKAMHMRLLDETILREHYAHLCDRPFFPELIAYMTSGPVVAMIVEGNDVINAVRRIVGATKTEEAAAGTIRGDFGNTTTENLIHASDAVETAEAEIARFFSDD